MKSITQLLLALALLTASVNVLALTAINVEFFIAEKSYKELIDKEELNAMEARASNMIAEALASEFRLFKFNSNQQLSDAHTLYVMLDRLRSSSKDDIQPLSIYWSWTKGDKETARWPFYSSAEFFDLDYESEPFFVRMATVLEEGNYQLLQQALLVKIPVTSEGTYIPNRSGARPGWELAQSHKDLCLHQDSVLIINSKWLETQRTLHADVLTPNTYDENIFGEIADMSALNQITGIDIHNPLAEDSLFIEAFIHRYSPLPDCNIQSTNEDGDISPLMAGG